MKESKFNFYEVVCISDNTHKNYGQEVVVRAKVQCDNGEWYYTVAKLDGYTVSLFENQMISLGRYVDKEMYAKRDTIKVIVNEDGEGDLKNPEDEKFFEK
jgi:hypothetical protein